VVTGLAAMEEGFVRPNEYLPCPGTYPVLGTNFDNWTTESLAPMDMAHALEASCDTYFYRLSLSFYADPGTPLQDWSSRFGLGGPTGVDLPGEQSGVIPDLAWRKATYGKDAVWAPGNSVNMSIGQGDLLTTPLQMTNIYAMIANGGDLHEPHLAKRVVDAAGKNEVVLPPGDTKHIEIPPAHLAAIRDGLKLATRGANGTATNVFSGFSVPVAGKTGTAEKGATDIAWFCGYAPADNPTIAACAMVEKGGHGGTSAAPVVREMFRAYLHADGATAAPGQVSD
jgi:penicillin-binding protein 2